MSRETPRFSLRFENNPGLKLHTKLLFKTPCKSSTETFRYSCGSRKHSAIPFLTKPAKSNTINYSILFKYILSAVIAAKRLSAKRQDIK